MEIHTQSTKRRSAACLFPTLLLLALPAVSGAQFYFTTNNGTITITGYWGPGGDLDIPGSINGYPVAAIGAEAFAEGPFPVPALTSVAMPDSITSIGEQAFVSCASLASVTLGSGVTNIGAGAFAGCTSLPGMWIPNNVTSVGQGVFYGCTSLKAIIVGTGNVAYCDVDGVLFDHDQTTLVQYPGGIAGSYIISGSVTNIMAAAFVSAGVTSVTVPDSVGLMGDDVFLNCSSLTNVIIGNGLTSLAYGEFSGCTNLARVRIGNAVTNLDDGAFYQCASLTTLTIPDAVTRIGVETFWGCAGLTNVSFGNSVQVISDYAFEGCAKLRNVTIPGGVTNIGVSAFDSCTGLVDVVLSNGLKVIGQSAFEGCASLASITIPDSVTDMGGWTFSDCTSLTHVTIPGSLTNIADYMFYACSNLTGVYFRGNAPNAGESILDGDLHATVYYLPGTAGWSTSYGGVPTALWQPRMLTGSASFGVQTNRFGFTVAWASGMTVVVEATGNLASPAWAPLQTNTLAAECWYFSEPAWTNYSQRFYRIRWP